MNIFRYLSNYGHEDLQTLSSDVEMMDSIIAGILQLIKVERAGLKSNLHLASFYNEWKTEGYFSEIEKAIKLPY